MNVRLILILILAFPAIHATAAQKYVDLNATNGLNSGISWANAYTNLTNAIYLTDNGTDLWVAAGTYVPGTERTHTFQLKTNVNLYGGFTNGGSMDDRNWTINATILSGEIGAATNDDNCYHVVRGTNNVILDGFTITRGYANGSVNTNYGGGMFNYQVSPVVRNCKFFDNFAVSSGGGVYCYQGSASFTDCIFSYNNSTSGNGGGLSYNHNTPAPFVSNCLFLGNTANGSGTAGGLGGGLSIFGNDDSMAYEVTVANCKFINNVANTDGGGLSINTIKTNANINVSDCIFNGNQAATYGAGLNVDGSQRGGVFNCIMSGNLVTAGHGAGMAVNAATLAVSNCLFAGNYTTAGRGGGLYNYNLAGYGAQSNINCTFAWNKALFGGAIANDALNAGGYSASAVKNCILWNDIAGGSSNEIANFFGTCTNISYSDVMNSGGSGGGWSNAVGHDSGGNLDSNPLFADGPTGVWTAAGAYSTNSGQTVLTNSLASWTAGLFAGLMLNPDTNQPLQFYIVTNAATSVTVWGDVSAIGTNGAVYRIYNYHPQSRVGHWTPNGWLPDTQRSPCIDMGDPTSPYSLEPSPNGRRINMGYDGNTVQASRSDPRGTTVTIK